MDERKEEGGKASEGQLGLEIECASCNTTAACQSEFIGFLNTQQPGRDKGIFTGAGLLFNNEYPDLE